MNEMGNFNYKQMSLDTLKKTCDTIQIAYGKLYDMDEEGDRNALFLKELCDCLLNIESLVYVYTRDGKIHPDYALEKLHSLQNRVDPQVRYWERKSEDEK